MKSVSKLPSKDNNISLQNASLSSIPQAYRTGKHKSVMTVMSISPPTVLGEGLGVVFLVCLIFDNHFKEYSGV